MGDCRISIDAFIHETFECMASVCAVFAGAAFSFQNIQLHTRRDKTELYLMAGSTLLSLPLTSISIIEKQTFPDIHTVEYEITTTSDDAITIDVF